MRLLQLGERVYPKHSVVFEIAFTVCQLTEPTHERHQILHRAFVELMAFDRVNRAALSKLAKTLLVPENPSTPTCKNRLTSVVSINGAEHSSACSSGYGYNTIFIANKPVKYVCR